MFAHVRATQAISSAGTPYAAVSRRSSTEAPPTPAASFAVGIDASPKKETSAVNPTSAQFLRHCASRWPHRTGGRALQRAAQRGAYEGLLAQEMCEADSEQVHLDMDRSAVEGLEHIYPPSLTEAHLQGAIGRVLHAWCVRRPTGYCQGLNFVAGVLIVVLMHGVGVWGEQGAARAEETAFWTFVAILEVLLPADFYLPPSMAGLQADVRALHQLSRTEIAEVRDAQRGRAAVSPDEWHSVLRLTAYKFFVPLFVNVVPLPTLLLCWDRLLLRQPPPPRATAGAPRLGRCVAHVQARRRPPLAPRLGEVG